MCKIDRIKTAQEKEKMRFIKVHIECKTEDLPEGIEQRETEFREGYIKIDDVKVFYPNFERTATILEFTNDDSTYSIKESVDELAELINFNNVYN